MRILKTTQEVRFDLLFGEKHDEKVCKIQNAIVCAMENRVCKRHVSKNSNGRHYRFYKKRLFAKQEFMTAEPLCKSRPYIAMSTILVSLQCKPHKDQEHNPGEVNQIFRLPNQSKLVEANRTIEIRLANSIERQSKFHIFFLINSIDSINTIL